MDKNEFLAQLRVRLSGRMEPEEMEKIISYYKANFDESQPERQRQVLEALGKTEKTKAQVREEAPEKRENKKGQEKKAQKEKAQAKKARKKGTKEAGTPPSSARAAKPKRRTGVMVLCVLLAGLFFVGGVMFRDMVFIPPQAGVSEAPAAQPAEPTASPLPTKASEPTSLPAPTVDVGPAVPSGTAEPTLTTPGGLRTVEEQQLDAFAELSVTADIENVTVEYGQTYSLTMSWYSDSEDLNWKNENGMLKIWSTYSGDGKNRRIGDIQITVPEEAKLNWGKLVIGLGDIEINGITADSVTAVTGMGGCRLNLVAMQEINAKSGMGDIDVILAGAPQDYRMDLETGMGKIEVNGEEVKAEYETEEGRNELDCSTGMGNISVSFLSK